MKNTKQTLIRVLKMLLIMTILCGIIYPLIVTGISMVFFKDKSNGSIIEINGVKYGSELLGQQYTGDEYLWGRVMILDTNTFTDKNGDKTMYAVASNISPASKEYESLIKERIGKLLKSNPGTDVSKIPVDLVTCSGSGLDPNISVEAAEFQIDRIAKTRNMAKEDVSAVIKKYTTTRFLGIFGENVVNVLKVNLALDGILK